MSNVVKGRLIVAGILIAGLAGCANTGQKTGEYVDDSWITSKVKSEMVVDKTVAASNITVNTSKGVVTLTGNAKTTQEANKAVEIARSVKGVTSVENDIRVQ